MKIFKAIKNFFNAILGAKEIADNHKTILEKIAGKELHLIEEYIPRVYMEDDIEAISNYYTSNKRLPCLYDVLTMQDTEIHYVCTDIYYNGNESLFEELDNDSFEKLFGDREEVVIEEEKQEEIEVAESIEEVKKEIEHEYVFEKFTKEEVEDIRNAIRPVIKNLNGTKEYYDFCKTICEDRILKTYVRLSEDEKSIEISMTQNYKFNEKIANYVRTHAAMPIFAVIKDKDNLSFDITDYGIIILHKMVRV